MRIYRSYSTISPIALIGVLMFSSGQAVRSQAPASSTAQAGPPVAAPPSSAPDTTVLHAVTNLVLVDVVVTDRDKTIHGLDRSRFHVIEDGREQTVASFDEHQVSAPLTAPSNLPKLPPNTFSNTPAYPATGTVNVLLLDALNTPAASQMDVRNQMIDYLTRIEPGTMLAIFTLSSQLRLAAGFTTNAAQLAKVLQNTKGANPSVVLASDTPMATDSAPDAMAMLGAPAGASESPQLQQFIASMQQFSADIASFQTDMRVRMTLDALQDLARYLNAVPGRKNLIWFSGSFPIALDPDDTLTSPFQAMRSYSDDIRETAELLTAARVAVYPVDARGLMSLKSTSAAYTPSATPATGNPKRGPGFNNDVVNFMKTTTDEHSTMEQIAEQTGGKAYFDTNGLKEAVARAIDNGSSYYTIGYVPAADKLDGHFHKIQVRIDNSGYKLAYRRGYYADAPGKTSTHDPGKPNIVAQAALPGAPPATQILFQARVLPASDPLVRNVNLPTGPAGALGATLKGPVSRYVIELHVDPHGLAFEDTAEGLHKADMEFAAIAYDTDEKRVNYFDRSVELNLKPDQYTRLMAGNIPALIALDLPSGKIALRIVIVDQTGGRAGSLEVPLTIASK